jgi:hypothetical protein
MDSHYRAIIARGLVYVTDPMVGNSIRIALWILAIQPPHP